MSYNLDFSDQAKIDIDFHKKSGDKAVLKKIFLLLNEISEDPFVGTGKPTVEIRFDWLLVTQNKPRA